MKTFVKFTQTDSHTELEINSGDLVFRTELQLLPTELDKITRALVFTAQNCAAHRFSAEIVDKRINFTPKAEESKAVSTDAEDDSQGSELATAQKEGDLNGVQSEESQG